MPCHLDAMPCRAVPCRAYPKETQPYRHYTLSYAGCFLRNALAFAAIRIDPKSHVCTNNAHPCYHACLPAHTINFISPIASPRNTVPCLSSLVRGEGVVLRRRAIGEREGDRREGCNEHMWMRQRCIVLITVSLRSAIEFAANASRLIRPASFTSEEAGLLFSASTETGKPSPADGKPAGFSGFSGSVSGGCWRSAPVTPSSFPARDSLFISAS